MKRRENESYSDYKKRRKGLQKAIKMFLKGRPFNPSVPKQPRLFPFPDLF